MKNLTMPFPCWNNKHRYMITPWLVCFLASTQTGICFAENRNAFWDLDEIRDEWKANYGFINSVKYKLSETISEKEGSANPASIFVEKVVDGDRFFLRRAVTPSGWQNKTMVEISSFDGAIGKMYYPWQKRGKIYAGKSRSSFYVMHIYLGLVNVDLERDTPNVRVLPNLESVAGQLCHVIEFGDFASYGRRTWVAHEKGMLLMKHVNVNKGKVSHIREVQRIACAKTDIGDTWYPVEATREIRTTNPIGRSAHKLKVEYFEPHIDVDPNVFDVDFPIGTRVSDEIRRISYKQGGPENSGSLE